MSSIMSSLPGLHECGEWLSGLGADSGTVGVAIAAGVGAWWVHRWLTRRHRPPFPPGPPRSLVSGNFHQIENSTRLHEVFREWGEQYGDVVGFRLGIVHGVVLNSIEAIQEAMLQSSDMLGNRPKMFGRRLVLKNDGVIMSNGEVWTSLRRFVLSHLRDCGMGKQTCETMIQQEADMLSNQFLKEIGKTINVRKQGLGIVEYYMDLQRDGVDDIVGIATSNIISQIIFAQRFDLEDGEFKYFSMRMTTVIGQGGIAENKAIVMPWLLPFFLLKGSAEITKMMKYFHEILGYVRKKVDEHLDTYDPENLRDFIDCYIQYIRSGDVQSDKDKQVFSKGNLFQVIVDLFIAGTETTQTTLRWALLYLIHHPTVQARCRSQIHDVIGHSRTVSMSDQNSLPYIEATILEIQRLASIGALAVGHATARDVIFRGYHIPEGTMIFTNLYAVAMDPRHWDQPEVFNPDRWLDNNNQIIRHESFLPFGVGPRICLGETLAKMELFIFLATMLQKFVFKMADPDHPPSLQGIMGFSLNPPEYELIITLPEN